MARVSKQSMDLAGNSEPPYSVSVKGGRTTCTSRRRCCCCIVPWHFYNAWYCSQGHNHRGMVWTLVKRIFLVGTLIWLLLNGVSWLGPSTYSKCGVGWDLHGCLHLENIAALGSQEPQVHRTLDGGVPLSIPLRCFEGDYVDSRFLPPYSCLGSIAFANIWMIWEVMGSPSGVVVFMLPNPKTRIWVGGVVILELSRFFNRLSMSTKLEWL